jgi:hypothetical protein
VQEEGWIVIVRHLPPWALQVICGGGGGYVPRWSCINHPSCKYKNDVVLWVHFMYLQVLIIVDPPSHRYYYPRLIINFIVPWGNFQAYLVRPDADEGPFSSSKRDHPSEKAWRQFMEGSTVSRHCS